MRWRTNLEGLQVERWRLLGRNADSVIAPGGMAAELIMPKASCFGARVLYENIVRGGRW